ncbi:MAG: alginate export family protein [Gammaproteobacteria bacterium]|nr:MAG: alginate export family protein [Gammaproteobacteria bacterium]
MNMRSVYFGAWLLAAVGFPAAAALAGEGSAATLADAVTAGKAHVQLRYRYEFVDQDFNRVTGSPFTENANASTLRVLLNYRTGNWRNWSAFGEFEYIGHLLLTDFNSGAGTSPGKGRFPVVADPEGPDLNQLYLDYNGIKDATLRFGRQMILLDNQRFVGPVGWRQNWQTYDAVSGTFKGLPNTELFYGYVWGVNRIFGERSPVGKDDSNTHLLNARIKLRDGWMITPYGYYIDSGDFAAFSTATFGARLAGSIPAGSGKIALIGEFATQSDAANAPVNFSANYFNVDLLWSMKNGLSLGVGLESLGGDSNATGKAFRTPLATLHAFQGWADQFLVTPNAGVDDLTATIKYAWKKWGLLARYHDFSAQSGNVDWGTELDFTVSRKFSKRYSVLFKGAIFKADDAAFSDVTKLWIMLTANY